MFDWEISAANWIKSHNGFSLSETAPDTNGNTEASTNNTQEALPTAINYADYTFGNPPTDTSELCSESASALKPAVSITAPLSGENFAIGSEVTVQVEATAANNVAKVEYFLDGQYKYFSDQPPYAGLIRLPKGELNSENKHTIKAKVIDTLGYSSEATVEITAKKVLP